MKYILMFGAGAVVFASGAVFSAVLIGLGAALKKEESND